jgi:hypothetical protein
MDIDLNIGFDVECSQCGATVKAQMNRSQDTLAVEPCSYCMDYRYNEGIEKGKEE